MTPIRRPRLLTLTILLTALSAWALQSTIRAVRARATPPASLAAMLPQGALLTIESPNFAALLQSWNTSPEQKAWLASANYSVFSNSRLFGRLNDARAEFESAASAKKDAALGIDADFLTQIAGTQSVFAWYDINKLEFLYITRISPAQAAASTLLQQRAAFRTRQAAGQTFYIRRSTDPESNDTRTVAFAQLSTPTGTLLLLATREDLLASALQLIAHPNTESLTQEPWYIEATAALPRGPQPPALRMVLNLDRIVPLPAFRSYWVQENITQMKQYRAAVSDLYRESTPTGDQFREERALLLKSPDTGLDQAPLATLATLPPPDSGVFRATATHDPAVAVAALEEKLLGRAALAQLPSKTAPDPTLDPTQSGSATDLETHIDSPPPVSATFSNQALTQALQAANLDAVLTYSAALPPSPPSGLWIPIHSAVVLHAAFSWNPQTLTQALQQSLRGDLTTATLGIDFHPLTAAGQTIYALTGPKPLFFAIQNNLCLLADDQPLLQTLLQRATLPTLSSAPPATLLAGFDHASQRAPYARLTSLIDGTNQPPAPSTAKPSPDTPATPAYFSQNLRSLSDSFGAMTSERFSERREGPLLRQTVTYRWQRP